MINKTKEEKLEEKKKNQHAGHRKRLKTKVENYGLGCLAYHEVLELLLTYTIPRSDTNPTAHNLIDYFGSFCDVIDADYHDLKNIDGIGHESALFINILSQFIDIYNKSKQERKSHVLNSPGASVKFFRSYYSVKLKEYMLVVGLSANKKVVKTYQHIGHDDASVTFDFKTILKHVVGDGVGSVVIFHTHPQGDVEPSNEDILSTQNMVNMCLTNGVDFDDHIILNETDYFSFKSNQLMDKMKLKFTSVFGPIANYIENYNSSYKEEK
ncbi:MAG: RadC family protein [Clostridia bacterium]|nr:RadC family protein [Clostridia bacterium]